MDRAKRPGFFWQGALILLPMFALTLAGLFSLWRDQINSRREADERASHEAAQLVENITAQFHAFPAYTSSYSSSSNLLRLDLFGETCRFRKNEAGTSGLFAVDNPGTEQTYRFTPAESWSSTPLDKPLEDPVYRLSVCYQAVRFCLLDARGNLSYPPPLDLTPQPLNRAENGRLRELWSQAQSSLPNEACQRFSNIATNYPYALSGSGLPSQLLARYQIAALRVAETNVPSRGQVLIELAATAVLKPAAISAPILEQIKTWAAQGGCSEPERQIIADWLVVWKTHEQARALWRELRDAGPTHLLKKPEGQWIVSETKSPNMLIARPAEQVQKELYLALENHFDTPYFAVRATLANTLSFVARREPLLKTTSPSNVNSLSQLPGKEGNGSEKIYITYLDKDTNSSKPLLSSLRNVASADVPFPGSDNSLLKIDCLLEHSNLLYAAQRRRDLIFALFLGVAAISAAAGLLTARRAFYHQLQVSEMKSNFVSAVSHELRAPIASVRLMAEGMDRGKISEPAKQKEYFRFIVQECRRLSSLIENVLDFSRIDQGRKRYEFEPTDLLALTQQTVNVMLPYAAERQVAITLHLPCGDFPQPSCDGLAIQQALVNLIDNAVKHSPPGAPITVGLEHGNGAALQLWVEDQGAGIPDEEQAKIFERFYRRGTELRRETQGVGIGLTIVKHIIEAHGGRVLVRSAVGKGSRFTLELPVAQE